mmetsp:Transcript_70362/g.153333  ORF Transcript_70362/g.153333 Transcript_70362/m.153333 type:complete len:971 (+) Transcript_70362:56-2968(+)
MDVGEMTCQDPLAGNSPDSCVTTISSEEVVPPSPPVLSEAWRAETKERWNSLTRDLDESADISNQQRQTSPSSEALSLLKTLRGAKSQRALDVPRQDLEEMLQPLRERVRLRCGQLMWNYDASTRFPRHEDDSHECRDGYELHLLQEGAQDIRKAIVKHFNHGCLNQVWKVVGGSLGEGIIVRAGCELSSEKEPTRLSHGSLLEQIRLDGDRLRYRLLRGTGPESGWISTKLKVKGSLRDLAVPVPPGGLGHDLVLSDGDLPKGGPETSIPPEGASPRGGMAVFGLMAAHISSEVRLQRLRNVLKSVRHQNVKCEDARFVFALSWSASSESFASRIRDYLQQDGFASSKSPSLPTSSISSSEAHHCFVSVEQPCRHSQFQHLRAALTVAEAVVRPSSSWRKCRPKAEVEVLNPCEDATRTPSCSSTSSFKSSSSPSSSPKVERRSLEQEDLCIETAVLSGTLDGHEGNVGNDGPPAIRNTVEASRAQDGRNDKGCCENSATQGNEHSRGRENRSGLRKADENEIENANDNDSDSTGESDASVHDGGSLPSETTSCWVIFGDDDDIWHPSRVAEYVAAVQQLVVPESVGLLATMARVNCRSDRKVTDWELPSTVEEVDRFLRSGRGARLDNEEPCKTFRSRLRASGTSLPIPDDLCLEYFDLFPRLRLLHEFFEDAPESLVEHRFCDLAFNEFLCSYPRRGRELGLEVHVFEPRCWMLFYATPIPDTVAWQRSVDGNAKELPDTEGNIGIIDVNNGHMSSSVDVAPVEVELARRVHEEFVQFDASLSVSRLARYWAAFRNTMEVYLMRKVSRKVDQRLFDLYVYLAVNGSFFKFSDVVLRLSQLKVECASRMMYYIGQNYAKVIAKRMDVSVLWHRPNIFLKPPVQDEQHHLAAWSPSYGYSGLAPPAPWLGKHIANPYGWGQASPFTTGKGTSKGFQKGSKGVGQAFANQALTKPGKGFSKGLGKFPWAR